ncbi:MAG: hypothetical protein Q8M01_10380 [Rubrivivax sp.]|nr:hypothetical protein [Rubrivivax sp.]
MSTHSLSGVTLQTLKNYRTAATQVVVAYRLGSRRLVDGVNGALQNRVYPRTAKMAPRATDRLDEVRGNVSDVVVKGIDIVAERTEQVIEFGSTTAAEQVKRVAAFTAAIENETLAQGLQAAARLTLPGAQVALVVSGKIAEGAHALADAAGARTVRKAVRKAQAGVKRQLAAGKRRAAPAARKARTAVKTATRRVTKAAQAVEAEVAKTPRRARAAKQAIAKAATA